MSNSQEKATSSQGARSDKECGLYGKYYVTRRDGSGAPGGKHAHCDYFVLDLSHDPHALPALRAYIASCRQDYPKLAQDLEALIGGLAEAPKELENCPECDGNGCADGAYRNGDCPTCDGEGKVHDRG